MKLKLGKLGLITIENLKYNLIYIINKYNCCIIIFQNNNFVNYLNIEKKKFIV